MSGESFPALMLAWRSAVQRSPEMLAAIGEEWDRWTVWKRTQPPDVSKPQLIVVVELSCVEDVGTHLGFVQLAALSTIRCAVVFSFPTESAAKIAAGWGRREPWHGLVEVVGPAERLKLLNSLPKDTPLAVLTGPAVLSPKFLQGMFSTRHPTRLLPTDTGEADETTFLWGSGFFGRAGDYADDKPKRRRKPKLAGALQLLQSSPEELGLCTTPRVPPPRNVWPKTDSVFEPPSPDDNEVDVPSVETGDEVVLRLHRDQLPSTVVERRPARLFAHAEPFNIRVPGPMLATAPKIVRLETYKANGRVAGSNLLIRVLPSQLKPWMLSAFLNRGGGGNPVIRAFSQGTGCRIAYAEDEPETLSDIPVVWGVLRESDRILAQAKAAQMYFFYIDHAYFDRGHGKSYRITRNRYETGPIRKCPMDRIDRLGIQIEPWRKSGKDIIVCPPTDYFSQAHDCADWLDTTLERLAKVTDRPVTIREKPKPGTTAIPLKTALKSAHALVTHSSNVAIEAACLGTPVFVNPASAAAPIGRTDLEAIEEPVYPDRQPWLAHLAYNQFSIEEIRDGEAWRLLLEMEERELA